MAGDGLGIIHTDREVSKATEEAIAPVTQPVTQDKHPHCVSITSAYSHRHGGLSGESLVSPCGYKKGGLKGTFGWLSTIMPCSPDGGLLSCGK
jgi:hypothetical protein